MHAASSFSERPLINSQDNYVPQERYPIFSSTETCSPTVNTRQWQTCQSALLARSSEYNERSQFFTQPRTLFGMPGISARYVNEGHASAPQPIRVGHFQGRTVTVLSGGHPEFNPSVPTASEHAMREELREAREARRTVAQALWALGSMSQESSSSDSTASPEDHSIYDD